MTVARGMFRRHGTAVSPELRSARRRWWWRRNGIAYAFLAPNLAFFGLFLLYPIYSVIRQSFESGGVLGPPTWVGLSNWSDALADVKLRRALGHTLLYTAMTVPTVLVLAMVLALVLRGIRRGGAIARTLVYVPSLTPIVLAGIMWIFVVTPGIGLLNYPTHALGLGTLNWLGDEHLALPSIALLDVWRGLGFWALFLLAGLLAVPIELYQAAKLDGASPLRRFIHVTLPGIRQPLIVAIVLTTLVSMQVFDSVFVLTNGGPAGATDTAVLYIYNSVFESGNPGYGAVLSLILMAIIVLLTAVILFLARPRGRRR
jgi:multiple sugar transport system permease protein